MRPVAMRRLVGSTLHGPHFGPNTHGRQIIHKCLTKAREGDIDRTVPGLKAVGIAGLGEELFGFLGIVWVGLQYQGPVELARDNAPCWDRVPERLRLVDCLPVDGVVCRQTHAPVVPRGRGIVLLVGEHHPLGRGGYHWFKLQVRVAPHLFPQGAEEGVGHIGFLLFEHGQTRCGIRDTLQHQPFDVGHLAPVSGVRFQDEFDAGLIMHKAIRSQPNGLFLEFLATQLLGIILWDNPVYPSGRSGVER